MDHRAAAAGDSAIKQAGDGRLKYWPAIARAAGERLWKMASVTI